MWPIKADSIEFCELESSKTLLITYKIQHCFSFIHIHIYLNDSILEQEMNACVRSYAIAKCLMKRGFEDTCNHTVA